KVVKVGAQKKVLQGAVFEVFNSANKKVGTITTNEEGAASLSGLETGKYTLKEVKAPTGYILNDQPQILEVKTGEVATITVENTRIKGNVQLLKVDQDGKKKLAGAVFVLVDEKGNQLHEYKTDKDGLIKVDSLPFGKYQFIEKSSPTGYILVKDPIPFNITENGKTIELTAKNKQITGSLIITKVDVADGNNKLPGAEFTIYDEQGKTIVKGKTNEEGIATFEKLPAGKYIYRETIAPNGYLINEETFRFEIKEDGQIIKHTVKDEKKPTPPTPETPQKPEQPETPQPQTPEQPKVAEKPVTPQPEKPQQIATKPQLEQTPKQVEKVKENLPTTGGKAENPYLKWIGFGCIALALIGFVFAMRNRKKAE
ncbi:adhesin, partial [Bacillus pseudomycoides]|uniref:MSCRAMM family protein n=1 Tax=Bacillus pseudomycoides TaxID=64104 RepID=UPI000C009340